MAKRFFIRKSTEEVLREEIRAQSATLQKLVEQQEEIRKDLVKRKYTKREEMAEKVKNTVDDDDFVYIPKADFDGEVSLKSVETGTTEFNGEAVTKIKNKKR